MGQSAPPVNRDLRPRRVVSTSWIRASVLGFVIATLVLGSVYFRYVLDQQAIQSRYLFYVLGESGQNLQQAIITRRENFERVFEGLEPNPPQTDQQSLTADQRSLPDLCNTDFDLQAFDAVQLEVVKTAIRQLLLIPGIGCEEIEIKWLRDSASAGGSIEVHTQLCSSSRTARYQIEAFGIEFTIEENLDFFLPVLSVEGLLENVFVANSDGNMLLTKGKENIGLVRLAMEATTPVDEEEQDVVTSNTKAEIRNIEIAGENYKLFLQPLRVSNEFSVLSEAEKVDDGAQNAGETALLIGGLASQTVFQTRTLAVPPTLVILLFMSVVVLLLMFPYLRVRFIGEREGLEARDVLALALTMLLGCALASIAAIHSWMFVRARLARDEELQQIATVIQGRLADELAALESALVSATENDWTDKQLQPNLLTQEDWNYPHCEMVFGLDNEGEQQWKISIKDSTTPLIRVADRAYFQRARDSDLWPSTDELNGRYVESIRSKTTGDEFAILSSRLDETSNKSKSYIAAIESKLLCLIDPITLPPYQFCVIDAEGMVQFHSDRRRNLRENFFDSLASKWKLEAAVRQSASRHCSATYRADPIAAYVTPIQKTPWTLIVFCDTRILGYMDLETLALALAAVVLYIFALVIGGGLLKLLVVRFFSKLYQLRTPTGAARGMWYWPNRLLNFHYYMLLGLLILAAIVWLCDSLQTGPYWMPIVWFSAPILGIVILGSVLQLSGRYRLRDTHHVDLPDAWPHTYAVVVVALLVTIGGLPPLSFYTALRTAETAALEDRRQMNLATLLHERIQRHVHRFRRVELNKSSADEIRNSLKLKTGPNDSIQKALDVHLPAGWQVSESRMSDHPTTKAASNEPNATMRNWKLGFGEWLAYAEDKVGYGRTFDRTIPTPNYYSYVAATRGLLTRNSDKLVWFDSAQGKLRIRDWRMSSLPLGSNYSPSDSVELQPLCVDIVGSRHFERLNSGRQSVAVAAGVTILIIVPLFVFPVLKLIFVRNLKHPKWIDGLALLSDEQQQNPRQLRLRFPKTQHTGNHPQPPILVDSQAVREADSGEALAKYVGSLMHSSLQGRAVHLTQFDHGLTDAGNRAKKLELLEYLVAQRYPIVIDSSIDPMFFLTKQLHDPQRKPEGDISLSRWGAVLQNFVTLRARKDDEAIRQLEGRLQAERDEQQGLQWSDLAPDVQDALVTEGWFNHHLENVALSLCRRPEIKYYSREDIIEQFQDSAGAHYRCIWSTCSTDEKVLLHRLAHGSFVNWRMKETVTSLMRRRLILASPDFRLMNDSFRRFVLDAEPAAVIRNWEEEAGPSTWQLARVPFAILLIFVGGFLIVTQRDFFAQLLSIVTLLTAAAPSIMRLLTLVMPGRTPVTS